MTDSYTLPPKDDPPPTPPATASASATPSTSSDPPPPYPLLSTLRLPSLPAIPSIPTPTISDPNVPFRSFAPATISQSASRPSRGSGHGGDRLSTSDLSLHTLRRTTLTRNQPRRVQQLVHADGGGGEVPVGVGAGGEVEEDASFWTARGTLRSVVPIDPEEGAEGESAGVGEGGRVRTRVEEHEVLVLVHEPNPSSTAPPLPGQPLPSPSSTSPLPSRFLYLFHPPEPPTSNSAGGSTTTIPLSHLGLGLDDVSVDPWEWVEEAKGAMERAFWGLLMPSVSGLVGMGEVVSSLISTPPAPTSTSTTPATTASPSHHRPHLYSEETIYTLRMPSPAQLDGDAASGLDLGPTLRPVLVKKRSAMPSWTDRGGIDNYGWGGDPMDMGVRF
ncbi:hypothetical protein IAT38_001441 [Cryptococcus sp. DSM 104549]